MKFSIEKKELSALTMLVYRAASNKNTIPALSGLLLKVDNDNGLTMIATDMEIGIKASTDQITIEQEGSVLINAHYFADLIKLLPDGPVILQLNQETSRLNVNYGRSCSFLNIYSNHEYPDLPFEIINHRLAIPQSILKEALRKTAFAAAITHFRPVFTGVLFDILPGPILKVVASDTHRLAYYMYNLEDENLEPFRFIIPTRTVNELLRILEDSDEMINIGFNENQVIFQQENFILLSRLLEGQYPNYEQVIPTSFNTTLTIDPGVLATTLERARIMPTDDKLKIPHVQFTISDNEGIINTYSELMGEMEEFLENINVNGDNNIKIAFNTNYFLDIVKIFSGECDSIEIKLSGSLGPALIKNPEKDNYLYILVPLRTSN
ncbi:DNA polymerase III subunit beta [Syntrophomonas erecta subsp. sporosyntropha]